MIKYFLWVGILMAMNKTHWHKCRHVHERHNSTKMLQQLKQVPTFTFALPNADVSYQSWDAILYTKCNLSSEL